MAGVSLVVKGIVLVGSDRRSLLDLLDYCRLTAPTDLVIRISRAGLLVFAGFALGRVTHEKSDIEKVYEGVQARAAQLQVEASGSSNRRSDRSGRIDD